MYFREPAAPAATVDPAAEGATAEVAADGTGSAPHATSLGMRAAVVATAVLAVALGVGAVEYGQLLESTIERLLA